MNEENRLKLKAAQDLSQKGSLDQAYNLCEAVLMKYPNDADAVLCMQYIMMGAHKQGIAYHLGKVCTQMMPHDPVAWMNAGMAASDVWQIREAERDFKKAMKLATLPHTKGKILSNWAATLITDGRFAEAEKYCRECVKIDPEFSKGWANLGFTQLAQRKWTEGWKNYRHCIGSDFRPLQQYVDEPLWDGKGKGVIVIYAEQGIGDVIAGASLLPDLVEWCKANDSRVILDVDARVQPLLQRSFPDIKVYGTREAKAGDPPWDPEDSQIDYSLPMLQLAEYFRNTDDDFPGTKYLVPEPNRALMWKSLFESKGKPCIGIAWRGGIPRTASRWRQLTLEQLYPILASVDAHWVSLQYKDSTKEIEAFKKAHPEIDIAEYPYACENTSDYDDTVALVSALDRLVIMQTSVGHVAGALEVPCWTFVPTSSQWRYGEGVEDLVWCKSVRLIRQKTRGEWDDVIARTAEELGALYSGVQETAAEATRDRPVRRGGGKKVRRAHKLNGRQAQDRPLA